MYKEIMGYSYNGLQWRNDICYLRQHGLISKHNKTSLYSTLQKENYTVPCSHQVTPFSLLSKLLKLALIKVTICVSSQVSGQLFPLS